MTTTTIHEAAVTTRQGGRLLIQLITPGAGSSGVYSEDVLRQAAEAKVFTAGTLMFADHPTDSEEWERPERSIRDVAGVLTEDAYWNGTALVAEARTFEPWATAIRDMADAIGVSIRATATITDDTVDGAPIIDALTEGISVDFVTYAGRGGRVLQVLESAPAPIRVTSETTLAGPARGNRKEPDMADITITEAEHKRLNDLAGRVEAAEAERDTLAKERDTAIQEAEQARERLAEAEKAADADAIQAAIAEAGVDFTNLERLGLRAQITTTEAGRVDLDAFKALVGEAAKEKANAAGYGRPTGTGATSNLDMSDADFDAALGIQR